MIDFKCVFESILTYKYTNEDLYNFLKEELCPIIFSYPCHSPAVEHRIKDITYSSLKLKKPEERDGMLINVINSRKIMPTCNTKGEFQIGLYIYYILFEFTIYTLGFIFLKKIFFFLLIFNFYK